MFNLLNERVIPVISNGTKIYLSLPDILTYLVRDDIDSFVGLRAHQAQALYQLIAQLGALSLIESQINDIPVDAHSWRTCLETLSLRFSGTAWDLVVEDPTKPAFFQPPTNLINQYKPKASTPDELDILVTAKNHDRKRSHVSSGCPHLWIYSLITLQTNQGYSGRDYAGIARMNRGYGSRVMVDLRPNRRWGPRVIRAIRMLIQLRKSQSESAFESIFRLTGGRKLLWLDNWDLDTQMVLKELDPLFIDICGRVRLLRQSLSGKISAQYRPASRLRVNAKEHNGNLQDPWIPIDRRGDVPKALTVSPKGFDYRLVQEILFDTAFEYPHAMKPLLGEEEEDMEVHMTVLVRGKGKTDGLHERIIPWPARLIPILGGDDILNGEANALCKQMMANLSRRMVSVAGDIRKELRTAILVYLQGPEEPDFTKHGADSSTNYFDREVDRRFFEILFSSPINGSEATLLAWAKFLRKTARMIARNVWENQSPPSVRREKGRAVSESILEKGFIKRLPELYEKCNDLEEERDG